MNSESEPLEDSREIDIPHPQPIAPSLVPPSDDLYLIVIQTHTPATIDTKITSPHSTAPSDSTTPLFHDHPLAQTSPALTQASYYHNTVRMAVHTQPTLSPGIYRGTLDLIEDTEDESSDLDTKGEGSEDEGPISEEEEEEEEAAPEGQQQAVLVVDTAADKPLGLGYRALRRRELALGEGSVPSTFEVGQ
ncbi:hypothetical protein Tco_1465758 [Tanacetum coccineum]